MKGATHGACTNLKTTWESNPKENLWKELKNQARHYEVKLGVLKNLRWIGNQHLSTYDQFVTLEKQTQR